MLDYADSTALTRQHELDITDQEYSYPIHTLNNLHHELGIGDLSDDLWKTLSPAQTKNFAPVLCRRTRISIRSLRK